MFLTNPTTKQIEIYKSNKNRFYACLHISETNELQKRATLTIYLENTQQN
jgi:hypothetical protein